MGKFRSKLKKNASGKKWARGQSSTSNPECQTHRNKAQNRFFQTNLSLAPVASDKPSLLTLDAVLKHDARQSYSGDKNTPTVNDISHSLKSFTFTGDDMMSESQLGTFKTFQTFASNWSACSNVSFSKLLTNFRADSALHKEMLAILAAVTEIINERGGTQTSTEYFLVLMETLEASTEDNDTIAAISLLAMGIKTVPQAILRKKFSDCGQLFMTLLSHFIDSENLNVVRSIIGCISVLLRAQEYVQWSVSTTLQYFDSILSFVTHTKPKIRKAAQHAVVAIIHGSCFMLPPNEGETKVPVKCHPVSNRLAKYCIGQFTPENVTNNQTIVLHTLGILQNTIYGFHKDDIKKITENLLSVMTTSNILIRTNCLQTIHALFAAPEANSNLTGEMAGKLVRALYDYRPNMSDVSQTQAWLMVMKQGHICLASLQLQLCSNGLPNLVEICCSDFWTSDKLEIVAAASNALKELLMECVKPCCTDDQVAQHRISISKVLQRITQTLTSPFGLASNHVLMIFSIIYEVCGNYFNDDLAESLQIIGNRYDAQSTHRLQIEHAVLSAISHMDTEFVLKCIPLVNEKGDISLNRSWMLPLLREGLQNSTLLVFNNQILKLASQCYLTWKRQKTAKNNTDAHVYELLCCQLWGLFPGFCRKPKDVSNFKLFAKILGTVLNDNPDLRAPVLDGLKELITSLETDEDKNQIAKFAKNFLPRLFNIYTSKPKGSYENEIRLSSFEVIKAYATITPKPVLDEMFKTALESQKTHQPGTFLYDTLFDITEALCLYQTSEKLTEFFSTYISGVLKREKGNENIAKSDFSLRRQLTKAYKLLLNIISSENPGCVDFFSLKKHSIKNLLLNTADAKYEQIQASRLGCLKLLIENIENLQLKDKLITKTITEAVLGYSNDAVKKANISTELIKLIGSKFESEGLLNEFVDMIIGGFTGDSRTITNTIWILRDIVQQLTGTLTIDTLKFILEQTLSIIVGNSRMEVDAGLHFLITFIKILPGPLTANHLPLIMKSLSLMTPDNKRHSRLMVGFILKKLCKRFGRDEIVTLVPGNDEVLHKRLRKIRKEMARAKRNRLSDQKKKSSANSKDEDDSDDELIAGLEKKSITIDDILADSDSDSGMEEDADESDKKLKKKVPTFIKEDMDDIVDLADINSMAQITSSKPQSKTPVNEFERKKDPNRGFKTAPDGRLIIEDIEDLEDSNDEAEMTQNDGYEDKSKKRAYDEDSDSDNDNEGTGAAAPKRMKDSSSMKSGRTQSQYMAGGKGIHRPVAASVKSGYSNLSMKSGKTSNTFGSDYRSTKSQGDVKKQGKVEPYAYVPLSRNSLNRRKKSKNAGQFKNIVKGARKGAAAGSKNRLLNDPKKRK